MPAKDRYHQICKTALTKDGWQITHDPYTLRWGVKDLFVDLGAERLIAAEQENQKIAVEVKSFIGNSDVDDLEKALGQYVLYQEILKFNDPSRQLFLAVREPVYFELFADSPSLGKLLLDSRNLRLVVFESSQEVITQWI
jgi:hypothetical protein